MPTSTLPFQPGVVTGKPIELYGSQGRGAATGRGVALCARWALEDLGKPVEGATIAMQGFGNVGSWAAHFLTEWGAKLVAVGDHGGYLENPEGFSIEALRKQMAQAENRSVAGLPGADESSAEKLFSMDVDVLIPAALGGVIDREVAKGIRASVVVEGANGPTDPEAHEDLVKRGVVVVPDILANAGGVTVSYFEWVQNTQRYYWEEKEVFSRLDRIMRKAYEDVARLGKAKSLDLRTAAFILAIREVGKARVLRGL